MGDRFENTAEIVIPALADYIRTVTKTGGTRRALASELAKKIVEEYEGSELGGENRTIQDAITDAKETASEAVEAEQTARQNADNAINADLAKKAYADGEYADLHAGTANQLLADTYTTDEEPYHYRQTPSHGTREIDEIVGGSVVWNQLVNTSTSSVTVTSGHKYVAKISDAWSVGTSTGTALSVTGGMDMVFDITQMFPSTIADHIYDLEQATAGAGIAFFKKYFGDDYHPYDAGTMRSVEGLVSHDMVGKNLLDTSVFTSGLCGYRTGETIDTVTASTRYCFSEPIIATNGLAVSAISSDLNYLDTLIMACYDSQGNWVRNYQITNLNVDTPKTVQIPSGTYDKIRVLCGSKPSYNIGTTVRGQIQVEFGSTATEYEPYEKHTYPLDNSVTLRGIPQLVDGQLKFDGDRYSADGAVMRRYGVVDLGTLDWTLNDTSYEYAFFYANVNGRKGGSVNFICSKYANYGHSRNEMTADKEIATWNIASDKYITIRDSSYTDTASFKSAMSGVMLVYELATPTTEQAEPYQELQICSPYGTEEYVSTSIVPIGHYTKYPTDLKGIVEQIADAPSADGTYTLKATVSNGVVTYSWESA